MALSLKKLLTNIGFGTTACFIAVASPWSIVVAAGEVAAQDNSGTVVDPSVDIATRIIFPREQNAGSTLRIRLAYDKTLTSITSPVIVVWGRTTDGAWQRLYNKDPSPITEVTLAAASTDAESGAFKYTECDPRTHAWDVDGCSEFIIQIKTALAGSTGSTATAFVQAKMS